MSSKAEKIAAILAEMGWNDRGEDGVDRYYAGYFGCFNRGLFYEAHEVLEQIWQEQRDGPNGLFYKGLIKLAGACVHLAKGRKGPAAALLRLARTNLERYPAAYERLDVRMVRVLIERWLEKLEAGGVNPLVEEGRPKIELLKA